MHWYRLPARKAGGLILPAAFLAFGCSDWIEMHTGAWWKPWWLLLLKATCVTIFGLFFLRRLRESSRSKVRTEET